MQLRYEEDLIEAVVLLCTSGQRTGVAALQIARFHRQREKLYAIPDPDDRGNAFFRLHLDWFREWDLENSLSTILDEFSLFGRLLNILAFRKARGRGDEGAELYVQREACDSSTPGSRNAVVAIRPDRFRRDEHLWPFLRHEFMHVHDMIDPQFGYTPEIELAVTSLSQQRLARERYRLLWDVTVDGRLTLLNRTTIASREERRIEFESAFKFWPATQRQQIFDSLWLNPTPTHCELARLAADPRDLGSTEEAKPGAPCPLCGFPTFDWSRAMPVSSSVIAAIRSEFPHWTGEQRICRRCHEAYEAAVGRGENLRQHARSETMLPSRAVLH